MPNVSSNRFESWPGLLLAVIQRLLEAEKRVATVAVADSDTAVHRVGIVNGARGPVIPSPATHAGLVLADREWFFLRACPPGRRKLRSRLDN